MSRLSWEKKHFRSGLVFAALTTSPAVFFFFKFLCVPSVLLPALSFFCFVLFCEWRQISSSAVLRRSVLQGISWLIHRLEPVTHPSCTSCRTQRHCSLRFFFCFLFFPPHPFSPLFVWLLSQFILEVWHQPALSDISDLIVWRKAHLINLGESSTIVRFLPGFCMKNLDKTAKLRWSTWIKAG